MGMTINISMGTKDYEFYNVPEKVGKAIITLLPQTMESLRIFEIITLVML